MSIIDTNRFDAYADRRLQARMGQAGIKPGTLIPGGLGGLLEAAYDVQGSSGDATAREFTGLLLSIDEAMSSIEEAKPADPLETSRTTRRSMEPRSRQWLRRPRSVAEPEDEAEIIA